LVLDVENIGQYSRNGGKVGIAVGAATASVGIAVGAARTSVGNTVGADKIPVGKAVVIGNAVGAPTTSEGKAVGEAWSTVSNEVGASTNDLTTTNCRFSLGLLPIDRTWTTYKELRMIAITATSSNPAIRAYFIILEWDTCFTSVDKDSDDDSFANDFSLIWL